MTWWQIIIIIIVLTGCISFLIEKWHAAQAIIGRGGKKR